jgi:DNA repair exonuclease SbcCD ATPase subunit
MGQSIAGHADSQTDRKRRRAFEFMFGLLDSKKADFENDEAKLEAHALDASKRLEAVSSFLEDAGVPTRGQLVTDLEATLARRQRAQEELSSLRDLARSNSAHLDGERDRIGMLVRAQSEAAAAVQRLEVEIEARRRLSAQISVDIDRLERAAAATDVLGPIDFSACPRCLQSVARRTVETHHCILCTQDLPIDSSQEVEEGGEIERLTRVRAEVEELLEEDRRVLGRLQRGNIEARRRLEAAEEALRGRADSYVAPLFDQIQSHSSDIAEADADEARLNQLLGQWDVRAEIQQRLASIQEEMQQVQREKAAHSARLEERRALIQEFSDTFDEIVRELELAWYRPESPATVNLKNFRPLVGGSQFDDLSGGQKTVVSVAYHLALLTVGLVHPSELRVPSLLILDTPSKYLGSKDVAQVARNFRRIAAIVDAYPRPIQIIVADNSEPPAGVEPRNRIELSYEEPLVPGVEHPGERNVTSIHDAYEDDPDEPGPL